MKLIDANSNKLLSKIYHVFLNMHLANIYSSPWICAIEDILNSCGLIYICLQQCKQSHIWVDYILKQIIKDQFVQRWTSEINTFPKCFNYNIYKLTFGNSELVIISSQSKLVDIQILPDKNDFVHVVIKDVFEMNSIMYLSVQNANRLEPNNRIYSCLKIC